MPHEWYSSASLATPSTSYFVALPMTTTPTPREGYIPHRVEIAKLRIEGRWQKQTTTPAGVACRRHELSLRYGIGAHEMRRLIRSAQWRVNCNRE